MEKENDLDIEEINYAIEVINDTQHSLEDYYEKYGENTKTSLKECYCNLELWKEDLITIIAIKKDMEHFITIEDIKKHIDEVGQKITTKFSPFHSLRGIYNYVVSTAEWVEKQVRYVVDTF